MIERRDALPVEELLNLRFSGVHIEDVANTYETVFGRGSTRELRPSQLIFSAEFGPRPSMVAMPSVYSWIIGALPPPVAPPRWRGRRSFSNPPPPGPLLPPP